MFHGATSSSHWWESVIPCLVTTLLIVIPLTCSAAQSPAIRSPLDLQIARSKVTRDVNNGRATSDSVSQSSDLDQLGFALNSEIEQSQVGLFGHHLSPLGESDVELRSHGPPVTTEVEPATTEQPFDHEITVSDQAYEDDDQNTELYRLSKLKQREGEVIEPDSDRMNKRFEDFNKTKSSDPLSGKMIQPYDDETSEIYPHRNFGDILRHHDSLSGEEVRMKRHRQMGHGGQMFVQIKSPTSDLPQPSSAAVILTKAQHQATLVPPESVVQSGVINVDEPLMEPNEGAAAGVGVEVVDDGDRPDDPAVEVIRQPINSLEHTEGDPHLPGVVNIDKDRNVLCTEDECVKRQGNSSWMWVTDRTEQTSPQRYFHRPLSFGDQSPTDQDIRDQIAKQLPLLSQPPAKKKSTKKPTTQKRPQPNIFDLTASQKKETQKKVDVPPQVAQQYPNFDITSVYDAPTEQDVSDDYQDGPQKKSFEFIHSKLTKHAHMSPEQKAPHEQIHQVPPHKDPPPKETHEASPDHTSQQTSSHKVHPPHKTHQAEANHRTHSTDPPSPGQVTHNDPVHKPRPPQRTHHASDHSNIQAPARHARPPHRNRPGHRPQSKDHQIRSQHRTQGQGHQIRPEHRRHQHRPEHRTHGKDQRVPSEHRPHGKDQRAPSEHRIHDKDQRVPPEHRVHGQDQRAPSEHRAHRQDHKTRPGHKAHDKDPSHIPQHMFDQVTGHSSSGQKKGNNATPLSFRPSPQIDDSDLQREATSTIVVHQVSPHSGSILSQDDFPTDLPGGQIPKLAMDFDEIASLMTADVGVNRQLVPDEDVVTTPVQTSLASEQHKNHHQHQAHQQQQQTDLIQREDQSTLQSLNNLILNHGGHIVTGEAPDSSNITIGSDGSLQSDVTLPAPGGPVIHTFPGDNVDAHWHPSEDKDEIQMGCRELQSFRRISDGKCISDKEVKEVVCAGYCLPTTKLPWYADYVKVWGRHKVAEWRCVEDRIVNKKVRLRCQDGTQKKIKVRAVRSCKCKKYWKRHNRTVFRSRAASADDNENVINDRRDKTNDDREDGGGGDTSLISGGSFVGEGPGGGGDAAPAVNTGRSGGVSAASSHLVLPPIVAKKGRVLKRKHGKRKIMRLRGGRSRGRNSKNKATGSSSLTEDGGSNANGVEAAVDYAASANIPQAFRYQGALNGEVSEQRRVSRRHGEKHGDDDDRFGEKKQFGEKKRHNLLQHKHQNNNNNRENRERNRPDSNSGGENHRHRLKNSFQEENRKFADEHRLDESRFQEVGKNVIGDKNDGDDDGDDRDGDGDGGDASDDEEEVESRRRLLISGSPDNQRLLRRETSSRKRLLRSESIDGGGGFGGGGGRRRNAPPSGVDGRRIVQRMSTEERVIFAEELRANDHHVIRERSPMMRGELMQMDASQNQSQLSQPTIPHPLHVPEGSVSNIVSQLQPRKKQHDSVKRELVAIPIPSHTTFVETIDKLESPLEIAKYFLEQFTGPTLTTTTTSTAYGGHHRIAQQQDGDVAPVTLHTVHTPHTAEKRMKPPESRAPVNYNKWTRPSDEKRSRTAHNRQRNIQLPVSTASPEIKTPHLNNIEQRSFNSRNTIPFVISHFSNVSPAKNDIKPWKQSSPIKRDDLVKHVTRMADIHDIGSIERVENPRVHENIVSMLNGILGSINDESDKKHSITEKGRERESRLKRVVANEVQNDSAGGGLSRKRIVSYTPGDDTFLKKLETIER